MSFRNRANTFWHSGNACGLHILLISDRMGLKKNQHWKKDNRRVGAGIYEALNLGIQTTVFQAELIIIQYCAKENTRNNIQETIAIYADR